MALLTVAGMRVLVVNAGSSSIKLRVLGGDDSTLASYDLPAGGDLPDGLPEFAAIGHRIVHGGEEFRAPVLIDDAVRRRLDALTALAPLHQPKSLRALDTVSARFPGLPAVACFDTAFHATLPAAAATYAIPARWRDELGVRKYGFHGLSHAYAARRTAELEHRDPGELRTVTCHLGAGASLAAVRGGVCVDTTMGFTPLDGLVMATRSGSVDPGAVLWLFGDRGLSVPDVERALEHESGLLALAGTADMRQVERRAADGDPAAVLALDVYVHRLRAAIGAMAAAMGGMDALCFTGGVGEHSAGVRARAAAGLEHLGVHLDGEANAAVAPGEDAVVGLAGAAAATVVVAAREDLEIARGVRETLAD